MPVRKIKRITGLPHIPPVIDEEQTKNPIYKFLLTQWRALWDWRLTIDDLVDTNNLGGGGGHIIQDEGVDLPQEGRLNFIGASVTAADDAANGRTNVTITATGGGHVIQDEGSDLPQRSKLNFIGAEVTATDDSGNDRTNVTVTALDSGGGFSRGVELTGTGTWTVPDGVSAVWITARAPGGGGKPSTAASAPGGGGGSGEFCDGLWMAVSGSVSYSCPTTGGTSGNAGGDITFGSNFTLKGGKSGSGNNGATGGGVGGAAGGIAGNPGVQGGFGSMETANFFGGSGGGGAGSTSSNNGGFGGGAGGRDVGGAGGTTASSQGGGGGGAASPEGIGGAGGNGGVAGSDATSAGAGGGGGGGHASGRAGGAGGPGLLRITWIGAATS